MSILKKGASGEPVRMLQEKLGVAADGKFGPGTEKALKDAQKAHGLSADGIAGPDSFLALGLPELVLLRVGTRGETVRKLQEALGIPADGQFGPGTRKAVVEFQTRQGLDADGMAGPATLARISAFATTITPEAVTRSEVEIDLPDIQPLPPLSSGDIAGPAEASASGTSEAPPKKSVWARMKGWFG